MIKAVVDKSVYRTFPQKPTDENTISTFCINDLSCEEKQEIDAEIDRKYPNGVQSTPNCSYHMLWMMLYKK